MDSLKVFGIFFRLGASCEYDKSAKFEVKNIQRCYVSAIFKDDRSELKEVYDATLFDGIYCVKCVLSLDDEFGLEELSLLRRVIKLSNVKLVYRLPSVRVMMITGVELLEGGVVNEGQGDGKEILGARDISWLELKDEWRELIEVRELEYSEPMLGKCKYYHSLWCDDCPMVKKWKDVESVTRVCEHSDEICDRRGDEYVGVSELEKRSRLYAEGDKVTRKRESINWVMVGRIVMKSRLFHMIRKSDIYSCPMYFMIRVMDMESLYVDVYIWNNSCIDYFKSLECGQVVKLSRFVVKRRFFGEGREVEARLWNGVREGPVIELSVNPSNPKGVIEVLTEKGEIKFDNAIDSHQVGIVALDELLQIVKEQASAMKKCVFDGMFRGDVQMELRFPRWSVYGKVSWVGRLEYVKTFVTEEGELKKEGGQRGRISYRWLWLDVNGRMNVRSMYTLLTCNSGHTRLENICPGERLVVTELIVVEHSNVLIGISSAFTVTNSIHRNRKAEEQQGAKEEDGCMRKSEDINGDKMWSEKFSCFTIWFESAEEYVKYCRARKAVDFESLLYVKVLERKEWLLTFCRIVGVFCLERQHDVPFKPFFGWEEVKKLKDLASASNIIRSHSAYYFVILQEFDDAEGDWEERLEHMPKLALAVPTLPQFMRSGYSRKGKEMSRNRFKRREYILNLLGMKQKNYEKQTEICFCQSLSESLLNEGKYDIGVSVYRDRNGRIEGTTNNVWRNVVKTD
ncbi:uncharacterized protein LOC126318627 isoform X1 [Schistocerca gregaria]|uniref:uncharacterized protein LOC126318627 isoform X1 n=1 Tax=Schistocerca gregaria TaxID=7010 RepID=UPI00211E9B08|nr:uncharacterized protein LOC126318627 isoform X1 [Schistocerca gregaria]